MKSGLYLLLLCLLLLPGCLVRAQVSVWPNDPSEYPAILQIDGEKSGLRLSRLDENERNNLPVTGNFKAKGLVIFNKTSGVAEYWDGKVWRNLGSKSVSFTNGLTMSESTAQLGGKLVEDTEIELEGKNMEFKTRKGAFSVNDSHLRIDSLDVKLADLSRFSVNGEVFSVKNGNEMEINASPFRINIRDLEAGGTVSPALTVGSGNIELNGNLQYKDGHQGTFPANSTPILFSDAQGNAEWRKLDPSTVTKTFDINWRSGTPDGPSGTRFTTGTWTNITKEVQLEVGKWLIIGRFASYTRDKTSSVNYLSMLRLIKKESGTNADKEIYISGILPERKNYEGNELTGSYAIPQIVAFVEVTQPELFRIQFMTRKTNTWYTTTSFIGRSYFRAIRIND